MTPARKTLYRLSDLIIALLMVTWIITGIDASAEDFLTHTVMPFSEKGYIDPRTMAAILLTMFPIFLTLILWEGMRGILSMNLPYDEPSLQNEALAKQLLEMNR